MQGAGFGIHRAPLIPQRPGGRGADGGRGRRSIPGADGNHAERRFPFRIQPQQGVNFGVGEPGHHLRGLPQRIGGGQHIGEYRAVIPKTVAIPPFPVFPGAAPKHATAHHRGRRVGQSGVSRRGRNQIAAKIPGTQQRQNIGRRRVVVHPGVQPGQVAADQVQLNGIKRPGRGGGAVMHFPGGAQPTTPDQPGRIVQQLRHFRQPRRPAARRRPPAHRRQRGQIRRRQIRRQRHRRQPRVFLI